jgi:hypothetical protein
MVESSTSKPNTGALWPILVLFAGSAALLVLLLSGNSRAPVKPRVFFIEPPNGATVPQTLTVKMGVEGLKVEPAGMVHAGAGHLHLLIDSDFIPVGQIIPKDEQHIHLGKGTTEAAITLTPGEHILRIQFANGAHIDTDGDDYRAEIKVTVQ